MMCTHWLHIICLPLVGVLVGGLTGFCLGIGVLSRIIGQQLLQLKKEGRLTDAECWVLVDELLPASKPVPARVER